MIFATDGILDEPPSTETSRTGWLAGDKLSGWTLNWLHRNTGPVQGRAQAMIQLASMSKQDVGVEVFTESSSAVNVTAVGWDVGVYLIGFYRDGTDLGISISTDEGQTFTEVLASSSGDQIASIIVVPGQYAVAVSASDRWAYAPYPYTTWLENGTATFTSDNIGRGHIVTTFEGTSQLVATDYDGTDVYLYYTPAGTMPTLNSDWSTGTINGMSDADGIATDGVVNIVAGSRTGGTVGCIGWAPVADGGTSGDWTIVDVGSSSIIRDVVYTGEAFLVFCGNQEIYRSTDQGSTWTLVADLSGSWASDRAKMFADPVTGLVLAYESEARLIYASRDRGLTWIEVADASTNGLDVDSPYAQHLGRLGYDATLGRFFAGDASTLANLQKTL